MKSARGAGKKWLQWAGSAAALLGFAAAVILLLLWLAGKFSPKVPVAVESSQPASADAVGPTAPVRLVRLPRTESAVGTIRAVHETSIGSRLLARVEEVNLKAGQEVKAGDVLVRLNDTDLKARLEQTKAAVSGAEATRAQAANDEQRYAKLAASKSISRQEHEKTATTLQEADANLLRARESVKEVEAMLEWATIRSPLTGIVIDKKVDVGDMVTPGQILATLFDPKRMQLVASVRESLTRQLQVGQDIDVQVEGLGKQCLGTVSEIVPEAQSASRAFQVKVTGPCPEGIYSGMFGRILIPLEEEEVLVMPRRAVRKVGQLELVDVAERDTIIRRAIRTGRTLGDDVEVLSGLRAGEQVVVPAAPEPAREASHE